MESGASLVTRGARIGGNVQADEALFVDIGEGTRIGGNVQIDKTSGTPADGVPNRICGATVGTDVQLGENTASFDVGCEAGNRIRGNLQISDHQVGGGFQGDGVTVRNNRVDKDVQLTSNDTASGGIVVADNRVKQNLQCVDNAPAPTGSGNQVGGSADEQCADLTSGSNGGGGSSGGASDLTCTGTVERGRYDEVTVPSGETCTLDGVRVSGNVKVESGGALTILATRVGGNVQTDEAAWVVVGERTRVRGNVQIDKTSGRLPSGPTRSAARRSAAVCRSRTTRRTSTWAATRATRSAAISRSSPTTPTATSRSRATGSGATCSCRTTAARRGASTSPTTA